ncbi:MAG: mevalonate kinase [Gammaproteobacteria bacterium]
MTVATAPGKLVIFGDYAVLEGAPAAATSVDVRAHAQVDVTDGRNSVFIDLAGGNAYDFVVEPGADLVWTTASPGDRGTVVAAVLDICHELVHLRGPMPALRISLNTDAFFTRANDRTEKLGLGSSAAVLVALTGALLDALRVPAEPDSLIRICHEAHHRFQGGHGSGIDVATAVLGGVIGVRRDPKSEYPLAESLPWPDGLLMLAVWSGSSASTPELLTRFNAYRDQHKDGFRTHLMHLERFAEQADAAWREGRVAEVLSALTGYDNALRALDYDAGIGINTQVHERLRGMTEKHGAVYKTSGAGGGDFGIVLTNSSEVLEQVADEMRAADFMLLDADLNAAGLSISPGEDPS